MCALGACGRSEALADSPLECCASGKSSWEGMSLRYVCSDLIPGAACNGKDDICWSKSCGLDGVCTKQVDGGSCFGDVDCQNNVCGRVEATLDASYVCCPSGESVDGDISGVCTAFGGKGAVCFEDSTCKSGICVQQLCKDKQENENDLCEADHHCASKSCIMGACAPFSSTNSRNEYFNGKAVCPLDTLSPANEGDTRVVSLDVYGDSTDTSWTDSMMNMVTSPSVDSSATSNTLVGQELLYGIDGCVKGSSVVAQRQGNKVCYGFQVSMALSISPIHIQLFVIIFFQPYIFLSSINRKKKTMEMETLRSHVQTNALRLEQLKVLRHTIKVIWTALVVYSVFQFSAFILAKEKNAGSKQQAL